MQNCQSENYACAKDLNFRRSGQLQMGDPWRDNGSCHSSRSVAAHTIQLNIFFRNGVMNLILSCLAKSLFLHTLVCSRSLADHKKNRFGLVVELKL